MEKDCSVAVKITATGVRASRAWQWCHVQGFLCVQLLLQKMRDSSESDEGTRPETLHSPRAGRGG
eukprot:3145950-Rhodomonas_salina.1